MTHNIKRLICSLGCIIIFVILALGSTDPENNTNTPPPSKTSSDSYKRSVYEEQMKAAEEVLRRSMETGEYQRVQKEVDDYCNANPEKCGE